MNISSCSKCGVIVDQDKVKYIDTFIPDDPEDNERDKDGEYVSEDTHYNDDLIWAYDEPLETWKCPVCKELNGKKE